MITFHGKSFIGNLLSAASPNNFIGYKMVLRKATGYVFFEADREEVNAAATIAKQAFLEYRSTPATQKAAFLTATAEQIEKLGCDLINTTAEETVLPAARLAGERLRTINQLKMFANLLQEGSWVNAIIDAAQQQQQRSPLPKPAISQMQMPIGPVAVFGASNFPLACSVAGGDTATALAAGCPVIFKAHPAHPATCDLVAGAIISAAINTQMPDGVFSMLYGRGNEVGGSMVKHTYIKAGAFTGSFNGGKALFELAVQRNEPILVFAEKGSVNLIIFLPGAIKNNLQKLAEDLVASVISGDGRFCINPNLFLVIDGEVANGFSKIIKEALLAKAAAPMLSQSIKKNYTEGIKTQPNFIGTKALLPFEETICNPFLLNTSLPSAIENKILPEEVFGHSAEAIIAKDLNELMDCLANLCGQLTAAVFADDELDATVPVLQPLQQKAARLIVNNFPTWVKVTLATVYGGPYPATTDLSSTLVGNTAIWRFQSRCFQNFPMRYCQN